MAAWAVEAVSLPPLPPPPVRRLALLLSFSPAAAALPPDSEKTSVAARGELPLGFSCVAVGPCGKSSSEGIGSTRGTEMSIVGDCGE